MLRINQLVVISSLSIIVAVSSVAAHAQPYGTGAHRWTRDMMGPGMMMGPGFMGRGGFGTMCSPAAAGFSAWRIDRLEKIIKPTDEQRPKFDELKAASDKASEALQAACPAEVSSTAVGRIEFMEKRLNALLQSIRIIRPALEAFYATLSDEQKNRLDSPSDRGRFWQHLQ